MADNFFSRARTRIRELIGSPSHYSIVTRTNSLIFKTRDISETDYRWWDLARRAKAPGLEISGLLIKPLSSKISAWVLGMAPLWNVEDRKLKELLNQWFQSILSKLIRAFEESLSLGNCYLVINTDLTVTIIPPHLVTKIVDPKDYGKTIGYRIRERVLNPENTADSMTYIDEYYTDRRLSIREKNGVEVFRKEYKNLIGVNQVVFIPNLLGADEVNGRPEAEALPAVLQAYGQVLNAAIMGNILQGRPTPVIKKMGDSQAVKAFWDLMGTRETRTNPDGTTEQITTIPFDSDKLLTLGGEAEFTYESPGSFSKDTETLLGLLFYLILQHSEIPEFVWGNAISSSKASAEAQLEPFIKWIEKKRGMANDWLNQIAAVGAGLINAMNPETRYGEKPVVQWQPIADKDGRLTLDTVEFAYKSGFMDSETALILLPVEILDPAKVIFKAKLEAEVRRKEEERRQKEAQNQQQNNTQPATPNVTPMAKPNGNSQEVLRPAA